MSYQSDRDQFIARVTAEGLPFYAAIALLRLATTINRLAELACSSEAADRDRVPCPAAKEKLVTFRCSCVSEKIEHCEACKGARRVSRPIARKPIGPCLCDDYPAGSHDRGQHSDIPRIRLQDWQAERRAKKLINEVNAKLYPATPEGEAARLANGLWSVITEGDPRGYTLRVIPPSYATRNAGRDKHNLDSVGVPPRESGLRF
jgi:hypothetical protein